MAVVKFPMIAEIDVGDSPSPNAQAQLMLDNFRESARPSRRGIYLYRAIAPGDLASVLPEEVRNALQAVIRCHWLKGDPAQFDEEFTVLDDFLNGRK